MKLLPNDIVNLSAASIDEINLPLIQKKDIKLDILRLDKIHSVISGNKWFKLKYYLQAALQGGYNHILTFGGAWSNHIVAAACAANRSGIGSIGIIRGEEPAQFSNSLQEAVSYGMHLEFVSRSVYKLKADQPAIAHWLDKYPGAYLIPEGGEGELGILGITEILPLVPINKYTHLLCAMGTGTMLLGLAKCALSKQYIVGIPVLKGFDDWMNRELKLTGESTRKRVHIVADYHFGGYAKKNRALLQFMNNFYDETQIPTDFVYTGKLMFGTMDLIGRNYFQKGSSLLVIHSGGLQGNLSLPDQSLHF